MPIKKNLNKREIKLVFDLYNLGYPLEELASFFDVSHHTIRRYVNEGRKKYSDKYTNAEMSGILTHYLLISMARNLHELPPEMQMRYLPDLLRIKGDEDAGNGSSSKTTLYLPKKIRLPEKEPEAEIS